MYEKDLKHSKFVYNTSPGHLKYHLNLSTVTR